MTKFVAGIFAALIILASVILILEKLNLIGGVAIVGPARSGREASQSATLVLPQSPSEKNQAPSIVSPQNPVQHFSVQGGRRGDDDSEGSDR